GADGDLWVGLYPVKYPRWFFEPSPPDFEKLQKFRLARLVAPQHEEEVSASEIRLLGDRLYLFSKGDLNATPPVPASITTRRIGAPAAEQQVFSLPAPRPATWVTTPEVFYYWPERSPTFQIIRSDGSFSR